MQTQWNSPPWSFVTSFTNYLAPHISCNGPTAVHERDDFLQLLSFMIFIFIIIITIIIIAVPMSYFPTMIGDFHRFREPVLSDFTATDGRRNSANLLVIESLPYQKKTSAFFFSVYFSCVKSAKLSHPSACQSIHQSINQSIDYQVYVYRNGTKRIRYCISINPNRWTGKGTTAQKCTWSVRETLPAKKFKTPNTTQATFIHTPAAGCKSADSFTRCWESA